MQSGPLSQNASFAVTLTVEQWNGVISAMAEAPFKIAAPLVNAITEQIQKQAQDQQEQATPPPAPQANNGRDRAPMPPSS